MAELAYICAYYDWLDAMRHLDDAERGRLFTALLNYGLSGIEPELVGNERFSFDALRRTIDVNKKNYSDKCEKMRRNGKKTKEVMELKCLEMMSDVSNCEHLPAIAGNCGEDKDKYKDKYKYKYKDEYKDKDEYNLPSEEGGVYPPPARARECEKISSEKEAATVGSSEKGFSTEVSSSGVSPSCFSAPAVSASGISVSGAYNSGLTVEGVIALYHRICISLPQVLSISEKRWAEVSARLRTYSAMQFMEMFRKAENSSFLKGANPRSWVASFDWLMDDTNFMKVLEGNFDDKAPKPLPEKPKQTRYVPNPSRDTSMDYDLSMAILEAEMRGKGKG